MQSGFISYLESHAQGRAGIPIEVHAQQARQAFQCANPCLPAPFLPTTRTDRLTDTDLVLATPVAENQLQAAMIPPRTGLIEPVGTSAETVARIELMMSLNVIGFTLSSRTAAAFNVAQLLCQGVRSRFSVSATGTAAMELAVQEAFINALAHGNLGLKSAYEETDDNLNSYYSLVRERANAEIQKDMWIDVLAWEGEGSVFAAVRDQGKGYQPDRRTGASSQRPLNERRKMSDRRQSGRGLDIIRKFTRASWLASSGTSLIMQFDK